MMSMRDYRERRMRHGNREMRMERTVWVRPKEIAHRSVVRDFLFPIDGSNL